jgi:hypothetical protein
LSCRRRCLDYGHLARSHHHPTLTTTDASPALSPLGARTTPLRGALRRQ